MLFLTEKMSPLLMSDSPSKLNEAERLKLYKQFQRHLIQLGVEMLKMLTISKNLY